MSADMRTPLRQIEGLGSAKRGTTHFLHQRMTGAVLILLALWFVASGLRLVGAKQADVFVFFASPVNAVLMFLFLASALYHMSLGLQVVIEDYVHQEGVKFALVLLNRLAALAIGLSAGLALLKLALSGP